MRGRAGGGGMALLIGRGHSNIPLPRAVRQLRRGEPAAHPVPAGGAPARYVPRERAIRNCPPKQSEAQNASSKTKCAPAFPYVSSKEGGNYPRKNPRKNAQWTHLGTVSRARCVLCRQEGRVISFESKRSTMVTDFSRACVFPAREDDAQISPEKTPLVSD